MDYGEGYTKFLRQTGRRILGAIKGKPTTGIEGARTPLSSLKESEGKRSSEPAHGKYEHNSPAREL
jgi:hypothetical protein